MKQAFNGLITSKMRVRILMRLFLNPDSGAYLRELATEFSASPGHVKDELHQMSEAGLVQGERNGRQVTYHANRVHPLFPELHSMVRKALGMDRILESIVERLGALEQAYVVGDYAQGRDTGIIDLVLVGDIDHANLADLTAKTERYIERRIRTLVVRSNEFEKLLASRTLNPWLLLWKYEG
jgi:predicted nucleotidyltransferase